MLFHWQLDCTACSSWLQRKRQRLALLALWWESTGNWWIPTFDISFVVFGDWWIFLIEKPVMQKASPYHDVIMYVFFSPTGLLLVTPPSSPVMKSTRATLEASGARYQMLSRTELRKRFPQLDFPEDVEGLYDGDAGAVRAERGVMGMQVCGNKAGWNRVLL